MDFVLTEQQAMFKRSMRDFATKEIEPHAARYDEAEEFPFDIIRKASELGLMGVMVPPEYGGMGGSTVEYSIALEEISRACASTGAIISTNNSLVCAPIMAHGNEDQKRRYVPSLAKGEKIGAFCLTEPGAGSDAGAVQTSAVRDGDSYVLNGTKLFITNGDVADTLVVFASTDKSQGSRGMSLFIVEKGMPGFSVAEKLRKVGIRASSTARLLFEDVRVPAANLLGSEGQGFRMALHTLDGGRIGIASQALGIAQAAFEAAVSYAKSRQQFGKPIAEFQAIQWMLADMATQIDAARLLTQRAANFKDKGLPYSKEAAMAKLHASETAMAVATKAIQVHGGYGYMREAAVQRFFRDAKITEIYEGTSEVQRLVIATNVLRS